MFADMSDEQIKLAKAAGRLATKHLDGVKLYEGVKIGASLLDGRNVAMKIAGTNKPQGKAYAEAFREWKQHFKFPSGPDAEGFYDAAIVCAQHSSIADAIIASLSVKQGAELGVFGLSKRIRAKLNEFEGAPPRIAPVSRTAALEGRIADLEDRSQSDPISTHSWRDHPEQAVALMLRIDRRCARRIARMILDQTEGDGDE